MIRFECDYGEGAHPKVLQLLQETNLEQTPGYGCDPWCEKAGQQILEACGAPDADVQFVVGGTQANLMVIASILRPYEGAISASTGHINVHETGAVEATGHKVLALPEKDGKISADQVEKCLLEYENSTTQEHVVKPGIVYISQPTEYGTMYYYNELKAISDVCRAHNVPLFVDGARLAYALAAQDNDISLPDMAKLCDVFYIGGTKVGCLFGEAIVFTDKKYADGFRMVMKQHGGMLAKGRLLGVQFSALFTGGLYEEIGKHADDLAMKVKKALKNKGIPLYYESSTNQQFCILTDEQWDRLNKTYALSDNGPVEGGRLLRICTSWATRAEDVDRLVADINKL
ncbi:MAG: aminotransferase class I/II-fold pyridoxal phosphate-dependent enzyme [Oscillospiraceae bacterium]|nr:aminotransferase class I/II-fold pyridoxal phosphate-dependent enzyme [Oscillospiraceae bacterium]